MGIPDSNSIEKVSIKSRASDNIKIVNYDEEQPPQKPVSIGRL